MAIQRPSSTRIGTFHDDDASEHRRIIGEVYTGAFRKKGIRISVQSGPGRSWNVVNIYEEEFDKLVTDYLRRRAEANGT